MKELDSSRNLSGRKGKTREGFVPILPGPRQSPSSGPPEAWARRPTRAVVGEPASRLDAPSGRCGGDAACSPGRGSLLRSEREEGAQAAGRWRGCGEARGLLKCR